jgi:hypothetical protein
MATIIAVFVLGATLAGVMIGIAIGLWWADHTAGLQEPEARQTPVIDLRARW